jgi:transposase
VCGIQRELAPLPSGRVRKTQQCGSCRACWNPRVQIVDFPLTLLESLRQWFEATLLRLSRKSDMTAAIRYALSRWDALIRYCNDGHIKIDNNAAERALRAVALGRKNYLFAGSDTGGERAAAIYSLIGSAKLNGLDPEAYLREVLSRIADRPITASRSKPLRPTFASLAF